MSATLQKLFSGVALLVVGLVLFLKGTTETGLGLMVAGAAEMGINVALPALH